MDLFVSGRLCLFGEHSDWAGYYTRTNSQIVPGAAIVTGIQEGIYAHVEKSDNIRFRTVLNDGTRTDWIEFPRSIIKLEEEAKKGGFFSYVAGVSAHIMQYYNVGGISIDCYNVTIPIKKGLSSSAAICVLVVRGFNLLYNLQISVRGEMEAAYSGEIRTPSRCGRLDQACAFGNRLVLMRFDGDDIDIEKLNVGKDLYLVFCNVNGKKNTQKILSDLNACYPYPQDKVAENVQFALGAENQRIIKTAVKAIQNGDAIEIGHLMDEAQKIFDQLVAPACESELKAPNMHRIMNDPMVKRLSLGAKGVGSQGDGAVQMICAGQKEQYELIQYLCGTLDLSAYSLTIKAQHAVKKAIIPLAGFGTRLFPATKAVDKAFFPIIDHDGMAKPAIVIMIEELINAGIEEIALIIQKHQRKLLDRLFSHEFITQYYKNLSHDQKEYNYLIEQMGLKISYVYQEEQKGFGHAVSLAKKFAGDSSVLLLLGDHLYQSDLSKNCATQVIEAFERVGTVTVSLDEVSIDKVDRYGILAGTFIDSAEREMQVSAFVEKPTKEYAQEYLGVKNRKGEKKYYCVFGQYVLTPEVFDILEESVLKHQNDSKEIELTEALDLVRKNSGMTGFVVQGRRFDIGIPEEYRRTVYWYGRDCLDD